MFNSRFALSRSKTLRRLIHTSGGRQDLFVCFLMVASALIMGLIGHLEAYKFILVVSLGMVVASLDWLYRDYWTIESTWVGFFWFAIQIFGITGFMAIVTNYFRTPFAGVVYIFAYGVGGLFTKMLVPHPKKKNDKLGACRKNLNKPGR